MKIFSNVGEESSFFLQRNNEVSSLSADLCHLVTEVIMLMGDNIYLLGKLEVRGEP